MEPSKGFVMIPFRVRTQSVQTRLNNNECATYAYNYTYIVIHTYESYIEKSTTTSPKDECT
jgi:hypothetical protein